MNDQPKPKQLKKDQPFYNPEPDKTRTQHDRAELMADVALDHFFDELNTLEEVYKQTKDLIKNDEEILSNGRPMNWYQKLTFRNNAILTEWKHLEKLANVSSFKVHPAFKNERVEKDTAKEKMDAVHKRFESKLKEWEEDKTDFVDESRKKFPPKDK